MTQPVPNDLFQVPIGGGINEAADEYYLEPPQLLAASNVVFPDQNTVTKRYGLTAVASLSNSKKLVSRQSEVLVIDGENAYAVSPSAGTTALRGRVSPCVVTRSSLTGGTPAAISAPPLATSNFDAGVEAPFATVAEANGYRITVSSDNTAVTASVFNLADAAYARPNDNLNTTAGDGLQKSYNQPRLVVIGTTATALYFSIAQGKLFGRQLDLTNVGAGWAAEVTVIDTGVANNLCVWDAVPITDGGTTMAIFIGCSQRTGWPNFDSFVILFDNTLTQLNQAAYDSALGLGRSSIKLQACAIRAVSSDGVIACAWSYVYDATGGDQWSIGTVGTFDTGLGVITAPWRFWNDDVGTSGYLRAVNAIGLERTYGQLSGQSSKFVLTWTYVDYVTCPTSGTADGTIVNQFMMSTQWGIFHANSGSFERLWNPMMGSQMMSRPFAVTINGNLHVLLLTLFAGVNGPGVQILYDVPCITSIGTTNPNYKPMTPMATVFPRYSGNDTTLGAYLMPRSSDVTTPGVLTSTSYTTVGSVQTEALVISSALLTFDLAHPGLWQGVDLGPYAYIAGGMPQVYDGRRLTEVGFLHAPLQPAVANGSGASGNVPYTTAMTYVVVYAQQDGYGNVHRSPPSIPLTFATKSSVSHQANQLTVFTCRSTLRQDLPDSQGGTTSHPITIELYRNTVDTGSVYQLVGRFDNDITQPTITFTDGVADSAFQANPILYSQGSVPAECPPSMTALTVHGDRLFGTSEDGVTQYFTTPLTSGEAPRFTDAFTQTWPEGPATAAWSLEGRLHQATANRIMFTSGDGPADTGAGSDFALPTVWQRDIGVVDANSVVIVDSGAVLNTSKGLYIEDRGFNFTWIGEVIQRTLRAYPTVRSMAALDADGVLRIALDGGVGVGGIVVHWDMRRNRWSTHTTTNFAAMGTPTGRPYSFVTPGTNLYTLYGGSIIVKEDQSTYLDNTSTYVPMSITTAHVKPTGMQGRSRLRWAEVLGLSQTPHGMTVSFALDYGAIDGGSASWSDAQIAAMGLPQVRFMPTVQKGESYSLTITDTAPTTESVGTGQGPLLRGLLLRVRSQRGEAKLPSAQTR